MQASPLSMDCENTAVLDRSSFFSPRESTLISKFHPNTFSTVGSWLMLENESTIHLKIYKHWSNPTLTLWQQQNKISVFYAKVLYGNVNTHAKRQLHSNYHLKHLLKHFFPLWDWTNMLFSSHLPSPIPNYNSSKQVVTYRRWDNT